MKNLISVYEETFEDVKRGYYENSLGEEIEFPKITKSFYYSKVSKIEKSYKGSFETKIYAEDIDTFIKAIQLGSDSVVLNMASFFQPGGGVEKGSKAQEEDLCRRSNLIRSLYSFHFHKAKKLGIRYAGNKFKYPLDKYTAIYSQGISIYKKPISYDPYFEPFQTSVISMAAIKSPKLTEEGDLKESDKNILREKIRVVLRVALQNNHTKLVLGAWGCGAYGIPSKSMANLFNEVLSEKDWSGKFEEICFAIIEDHNSQRNGGNLQSFIDVFGTKD